MALALSDIELLKGGAADCLGGSRTGGSKWRGRHKLDEFDGCGRPGVRQPLRFCRGTCRGHFAFADYGGALGESWREPED
jgi:hypothetical protein